MTHDPWASGVLKPDVHDRLVADIDRFAEAAGITKEWVWTSMIGLLTQEEIDWVNGIHKHKAAGKYGLVYVGETPDPDMETRMSLIAGCMLRNFIRAQVLTFNQIAEMLHEGDTPQPTLLLIPNFFVAKPAGEDKYHPGSTMRRCGERIKIQLNTNRIHTRAKRQFRRNPRGGGASRLPRRS